MADTVGATEAEFRAQLRTTAMYYQPHDAAVFTRSRKLEETMVYVRDFSFDHGLYGGGKTRDYVGIAFPDGTVLGNKKNVKLRFDDTFMQLAADGKL